MANKTLTKDSNAVVARLEASGIKTRIEKVENSSKSYTGVILGEGQVVPTVDMNELVANKGVDGAYDICVDILKNAQLQVNCEDLSDYEKIKETLFVSGISEERAAEEKGAVIIKRFDMNFVIKSLVDTNDDGNIASFTPLAKNLAQWGVTEEKLIADALANSDKVMKPSIQDLFGTLRKMGSPEEIVDAFEAAGPCPFFILTNEKNLGGAAVLLSEVTMKSILDEFGPSYILPSSIHEVLVLPDRNGADPKELLEMNKSVNETQVRPEEVLATAVYRYDEDGLSKVA